MIIDFARLHAQGDEQIRSFAEKWGPLFGNEISKEPWERTRFREELDDWRSFSRDAENMLKIMAELQGRGMPDGKEPIDRLRLRFASFNRNLDRAEDKLAFEIDIWLQGSNIGVEIEQGTWPPRLKVGFGSLLSRLAIELIAVMTKPPGIWLCSRCEQPYWPVWRTPDPGKRHYCASCSVAVKRERSLASWHKNKQKYRPRTSGAGEVNNGE